MAAQRGVALELVVVDDGSKDATPEVLALLRTLASEDTSLAALLPPPPTDAR